MIPDIQISTFLLSILSVAFYRCSRSNNAPLFLYLLSEKDKMEMCCCDENWEGELLALFYARDCVNDERILVALSGREDCGMKV